ncbi:hypothetical protein KIW84_012021 [Lathyrus oleraceus]|uniref:PB1-like domain-containing protein n=1 Tax=Pisum sativum TaxID=3888 RepID=A0A9D5BGJ4_PEA|nr:hypothetical protein KIW84_012021 [Pisum sativum]
MDSRFKCIVCHGDEFLEFKKLGYKGLEETRDVDPDFWSYFEVLSGLKDSGYPNVDTLWYYDQVEFNSMVLLKDDNCHEGTIEVENIVDKGEILDKGTTEAEIVVDEREILNKGTTKAETVVDEEDILNKGATKVEIVMDDTVDEGLNCNMEQDEGLAEDINLVDEVLNSNSIEDEGLGDLFEEYYSEYDCVGKGDWKTFKVPKRMDDYKWEFGTYFATKENFKDGIRTYAYTLVGT